MINAVSKKIALIGIITLMIGISTATEIRFAPDHWDIKKWCLVVTDIIINTDNAAVATTDIVLETSLEYVDFVPTKNLFPYFFPPKVKGDTIHIVWFIANPKNTVTGSGVIGKLFLKQKSPTDSDAVIKLFFAGQGKTYDSNLSILWWIDVLQNVGSWYYQLLDTASCEYPSDYIIVGWFAHKSAQSVLDDITKQISYQEWLTRLFSWQTLVVCIWLLIFILFIFIKKHKRWKWKWK